MKYSITKIAMFAISLLVACGAPDHDEPTVPGRWYTESQIEAGRGLFAGHCAVCHGADGSGTADWRTAGPDGQYPPPPLNGTAHTWHHALEQIDSSIVNGGTQFGGVMPGFGAALNEAERLSIIAFVQSLWPDEIYAKWESIDRRSR
jgi:mono/diheme cytochrome c family protein